MPVVPDAPEFEVGILTAGDLNTKLGDPTRHLLDKPIAQMRQTSNQAIPNNTWTALALDTEDVDSAAGHDNSTNNSRYTAQYDGWYLAGGGVGYSANATGRRGYRYAINGTVVPGSDSLIGATATGEPCVPGRAMLLMLEVGDYVEAQVFQNSGGALNTTGTTAELQPTLTVTWNRRL